jgi:lipoate-protein ligase A
MLCDANALAFSIATPRGTDAGFTDPVAAHKFYGKIVQDVLRKFGVNDTVLGEQFYIKVKRGDRNLPLVGTAQRQEQNARLYHGIITIEPWSADYLNSILALRAKNGLREYDLIAALPSVREYTAQPLDTLKNDIRKALAEAITGSPALNAVDPSLRNGATTLVNAVYRDPIWRDCAQHLYWEQIGRTTLNRGLGFCLLGSEFQ